MRVRRKRDREEEKTGLSAPGGPIGYRVPVGESGSSSKLSARRTDSIVRVYAFERQHTAFQRIAAKRRGEDFDVTAQRVSIRTAIGPDGRVVATAGETTTVLTNAEGRTTLLRELAFVSDLRKAFLSSSGLFFGQGRRILPQFDVFDAFASRLRVEQAAAEVAEANRAGILEAASALSGGLADGRRGQLSRLEEGLKALLARARELAAPGLFDGARVTVSDPDVASGTPAPGPLVEGTASLSVLALAAGESIASDPVSNAATPLGLAGDIYVNDVRIRIEESDGLGAIMRRINHGEDTNENGRLDNAEDRNFSGTLNHGEDANGNGVLDTGEDADGDGVLDKGEDANYNGRLDVSEDRDFDFELDLGVAHLGIRARIEGNRLVVTAPSADIPLRFEDPDGILESIGLLTQDANLQLVPKTRLDSSRDASLAVDGRAVTSPSNTVTGAVPSARLVLKNEGEATVTVDRSFDPVVEAAGRFVAQYNETIGFLNGFLLKGGLFDAEPVVSGIRQEVGNHVEGNEGLASAGISAARGPGRLSVHELELDVLVTHLRQGVSRAFDRATFPRTAANSIASLGITRVDDGAISFDPAAFRAALGSRRGEVTALLVGEDGAATGIAETLALSTDPETGRLKLLGERLKDDPESERDLARLLDGIFAKHFQASAIGGVTDRLG